MRRHIGVSRAPKFRHHADGGEFIASDERPPFLRQTISRLLGPELPQSASNWIKWHNPEPRAVHNLTKATETGTCFGSRLHLHTLFDFMFN